MRLAELEADCISLIADTPGHRQLHVDFATAQGIIFLCPLCFERNHGRVGTHSVICWSRSRGVPDQESPGPGRWIMRGTSLDDLTLEADPPSTARSVLLTGPGCGAHFFITDGQVVMA